MVYLRIILLLINNMSNFKCKIRVKETGEIFEAQALDNLFGHHMYGYKTSHDGHIYEEDEVDVIIN